MSCDSVLCCQVHWETLPSSSLALPPLFRKPMAKVVELIVFQMPGRKLRQHELFYHVLSECSHCTAGMKTRGHGLCQAVSWAGRTG